VLRRSFTFSSNALGRWPAVGGRSWPRPRLRLAWRSSRGDRENDGPERGPQRTMHALEAIAVIIAALLLAALLNADGLVRGAEKKPYGDDRDFWLGVWHPVQSVSQALYLDRPRQWLSSLTGHDQPPPPRYESPDASGQSVLSTPEPQLGEIEPPSEADLEPPVPSLPSRPPLQTFRTPTEDAPLNLWVGGDSLAGIFGLSLLQASTDTGLITASLDYRISTGLTRPDYFDWPAHLSQLLSESHLDVIVVLFGGNDSQPIRTPEGQVYQPETDAWRDEYRRRVSETMDLLSSPDRLVVWVGLPPMRNSTQSRKGADINRVDQEAADGRSDVVFVDTWSILGDASGGYAAYLPDLAGNMELVRAPDGVHLTRAGGDRLVAAVFQAVASKIRLDPRVRP
jgi:hypothetical protein